MKLSEAVRVGAQNSQPLQGRHVASQGDNQMAADAAGCAYWGLVGAWPDNNPLMIAKAAFSNPFAPISPVIDPTRRGEPFHNGWSIIGIMVRMNDTGYTREQIADWLEAIGF